jgi:hypothetical protein
VIASDIVNPENMTVAFEDIGNMWQNPIEVWRRARGNQRTATRVYYLASRASG